MAPDTPNARKRPGVAVALLGIALGEVAETLTGDSAIRKRSPNAD